MKIAKKANLSTGLRMIKINIKKKINDFFLVQNLVNLYSILVHLNQSLYLHCFS